MTDDEQALVDWATFYLNLNYEPCWLDHHGYCQAHSLGSVVKDGMCEQGIVQEIAKVRIAEE